MTSTNFDVLIKQLASIQSSISSALNVATEFEGKVGQLRKQLESIKAESLKSREYLQRLSKVRV